MAKKSKKEHPLSEVRRAMGDGKKALSQAKLGALVGVPRHTIDNIENKDSPLPLELARLIADHTGVKEESLFADSAVDQFGQPFNASSYKVWRAFTDDQSKSPPDWQEKQYHLASLIPVLLEAAHKKGHYWPAYHRILQLLQHLRAELELSEEIDAILGIKNKEAARKLSKEDLDKDPVTKELLGALRERVGGTLYDLKGTVKVGGTLMWPPDLVRDDLPELPEPGSVTVEQRSSLDEFISAKQIKIRKSDFEEASENRDRGRRRS